ncbi:MAG: TonB-dependent receptor plug domain-containing protein, partial [Kiritimatiellae bacterium]|nr:TonB-dependent receptor plug domain-containing protein [Kiritimatiellia bacterium]
MSFRGISVFIVPVYMILGITSWAQQTNSPSLKEIVVIGTRTEKDVKDVPATVQVIEPSAVKSQNPVTIDELFGRVAGVDLQGSGFPGSFVRLNMRGLSDGYQTERVLVLQDGRRVNDQYQGNVEFSMIPADGVEKVELLRGPASALYGYNAMAGVINIISKTGTTTPTGRLSAEIGTHDTYHYSAEHGWKTGPFDYFIAGSHIETDGYMLNSDGTKRDWEADNVMGNFGLE